MKRKWNSNYRKSNAKKTHRPRPNDSDTLYPWVRGFQPLTPPQKNWSYPQPAWAHLAVGALKEKLCVGYYIDLKPTTDRVPWRCPFLDCIGWNLKSILIAAPSLLVRLLCPMIYLTYTHTLPTGNEHPHRNKVEHPYSSSLPHLGRGAQCSVAPWRPQ